MKISSILAILIFSVLVIRADEKEGEKLENISPYEINVAQYRYISWEKMRAGSGGYLERGVIDGFLKIDCDAKGEVTRMRIYESEEALKYDRPGRSVEVNIMEFFAATPVSVKKDLPKIFDGKWVMLFGVIEIKKNFSPFYMGDVIQCRTVQWRDKSGDLTVFEH